MTLTQVIQIHLASLEAGHADFEDTLALVERFFLYQPSGFRNGSIHNAAGENEGSCKVFSLAYHCNLTEAQTLLCFGRHYRDVVSEPAGTSHGNIRQFMGTGWSGIHFEQPPLRRRPAGADDQLQDETTS